MTEENNLAYFRSKGLLPFQAMAVRKFLKSEDKPYWQIISPVGTGKSHMGAVIASEIMKDRKSRVLVLVPSALCAQWQSVLSRTVLSGLSLLVNRNSYLEIESHVSVGQDPWPDNSVIIMSIDLAKRDDFVEKITNTSWDLVIFDESHLLTGKRKELFEKLSSSGKMLRCLLLTCTESSVLEGIETIVIDEPEIVDWDHNPIYGSLKMTIVQLPYTRTKEELAFLDTLYDFAKLLSDQWSYGKLQSEIILKVGSSSIYSAEIILRRLQDKWRTIQNKIINELPLVKEDVEKIDIQISPLADELEISEESAYNTDIQPHEFLNLYKKLELLLYQAEEVSTDSKYDVLVKYLKQYHDYGTKRTPYMCICSPLTSTVQYLSAGLRAQNVEFEIYTLTGSLPQTDKERVIHVFREHGGVLIATDRTLEKISLEYVDECINYDLPYNMNIFEQRMKQFLRAGRRRDFKLDILIDESNILPWEKNNLNIIKKYIESSKVE